MQTDQIVQGILKTDKQLKSTEKRKIKLLSQIKGLLAHLPEIERESHALAEELVNDLYWNQEMIPVDWLGKAANYTWYSLRAERPCEGCGTILIFTITSRTKRKTFLQQEHFVCDNCMKQRKEKQKAIDSQWQAERNKQFREEQCAIVNSETAKVTQRFYALGYVMTQQQVDKLLELPYYDFLNTVYWQVVRKYTLYKRHYKCELCNTTGLLNVHHRTYEHHGIEHLHLEDLVVLCQNCHAKFHDKLAEDNNG